MSDSAIRPVMARLGVSLAGLLLASLAVAAAPPEPPEPPEPPGHKEISLKGLTIRKGEERKGDVIMFAPSVNIEGTLDGDLWVTTSSARISGVVTGDAFIAGSQIEITGEIKKSLRCTGANVVLDGTVAGSVLVAGGTLTIGSNARIMEGASVYTAQMTDHGIISESLVFKGGTAVIGGKVMENADLTADTIEIEPGARIEGDVTYSTRKAMDAEIKAISGGDVTFDEKRDDDSEREKKRGREGGRLFHPTTFSVGVWIAWFVASYLFGCALLAIFKHHEPGIDAAIASDTLRTAGLGFVSVLATIAVCFSAILLVTIPFVVIYLIAYAVAAYLAKIPVAVWLGRRIFRVAGRATGPYAALFVGLVAVYLVFMIPILGILAQVAVALLGLGAMVSVYIAQRQARRAAAAAAAMAPEAPPAAS